jgi:hypothetical protein
LILGLVSCEQHVATRNLDVVNRLQKAVQEGERREVSIKEVESILGQPAESRREKRPREVTVHDDVVLNIYNVDGRKMLATFVDGRLTGPVVPLDASAAPSAVAPDPVPRAAAPLPPSGKLNP